MVKNVTFIDDLFDADTLTSGNQIQNERERDQYSSQALKRHIRNNNVDYSTAMNGGTAQLNQIIQTQPMMQQPPNQFMMQQPTNQFMMQPQLQPQIYDQYYPEPERRIYDSDLSCITIANHIKECPICSKFYNCDNSIYIVCIVLLIIVCIILLKRIIEKN